VSDAAAAIGERRARPRSVVGGALIVALTLLAYAPALRGGFVADDEQYLADNSTLHAVDGLRRIWFDPAASPQYYPLTFTTFWIEHQVWGLNPLGYHVVNVLLHAANALALWLVLHRLRIPGAWLASAIFALHPVHVESVAWIAERKDVLSGLFSLLAVLAWVRFTATRRWRDYLVVGLWFSAALLSKTVTLTLPLILWLLVRWRKPARVRAQLPWLLSLLPLSVAAIGLTTWCEHLVDRSDTVMRTLSLGDRVLIAGRAFWFYLGKLLWPTPLMPYYPRWHVDTAALWQYLFPLSAAALVAALWSCRKRFGSGPLVAIVVFVVALAPILGLVNFNFMTFAYVADHFQYLPSIGPIALFAAAMVRGSRAAALPRVVAPVAAAALLGVLGLLTWRQALTYRDEETQMRDCLAKNPSAAGAHYNLGTVLLRRGDLDAARPHFLAALQEKPDYADAHNNLGVLLLRQEHLADAMAHFTEAAQLQPFDYRPQQNLGAALERLGRDDEAKQHYAAAVRIAPNAAESQGGLGKLLLQQHELDAATTHLAAAVQLRPEDVELRTSLAQALELQGKTEGAMEQYAVVLQTVPANFAMQAALATYLLQHGRLEESVAHFAIAAQLQPDAFDVHNNWGAALGGLGRVGEAIVQFKEALRIKPNDADAQGNLAQALAQPGAPPTR